MTKSSGDDRTDSKPPKASLKKPASIALGVGVVAAVLTKIAAEVAPDQAVSVATAALVIGACLVTMMVKSRKASSRDAVGAASTRELSDSVAGSVLRDGLVAGIVIGVGALALPSAGASLPVFALVAFLAVDFWGRYYRARRLARSAALCE